eukprot:CAMPEP_0184860620 /NCGR_PEP_ID=MMETSP0580-20130426/5478_1 /TAXON_ID=1118495 /ORGANISM="Dactyliosolen fragilissimus" /LENGTH=239 /DNA_ID=CAMNT_0027357799 /DNA_START=335 /DNA_END=1054 /DNA_ORIENTATION=+
MPDDEHSSIIAVINTPKTGTGELTNYATHDTQSNAVFRTHSVSSGLQAVTDHRIHFHDPSHQCIILTTIREPNTWIKSLFMEQNRDLCVDDMTMDRFFQKYLEWLHSFNYKLSSQDNPIHGLLQEFGSSSLTYHFENFDKNGGYSLLHHPSEGPLQGCKLLFLRMEDASNWSNILTSEVFDQINPYNPSDPTSARRQHCSQNVNDLYSEFQTYSLTEEERNVLVGNDSLMEEYLQLYGL